MVAMIIDGPLREKSIGLFVLNDLREGLIVRFVDDGAAISLSGIERTRREDIARGLGFSDARFGRGLDPGAIVQVEQRHLVAEIREARNRSAAAVFGITRV